MNFLFPQFLFGLLSIGIPIIIHLFNLQKTRKVYFSNTAFLKNVQSLSKRSIKVKNLLILLSRILFLTFLVFAFAQPYRKGEEEIKHLDFVNLYIDNSLSTQTNIGNDRVLDISVKGAETLASTFSENAIFNVFTNEFGNLKGQFLSKKNVEEFISGIDFSPASKTLYEVFNKRTLQRNAEFISRKKALFVFSDFQKSTLGNLNNLKVDSSISYTLVPVTPENISNIFIDSVWMENPYININENNQVTVRVVNSGDEAKKNVLLKLSLDGSQIATSSVNLGANSNENVSFNFSVSTPGIKRGVINISDYPVIFDNDYFFSFRTISKIKILEITSPTSESPYVGKVFQDKNLFDVTIKDIDNLDYNLLQQYSLIVLNNLQNIPDGFDDELSKFLNTSGAVLVIPSESPDIVSYNKFLNQYSVVVESAHSKDSVREGVELQQPDLNNPFFRGIFENMKERMMLPKEKMVLKFNNIGNHILNFRNGNPFLTQINNEKSKLFIFATDLKSENGFALNALYVPVMYKMALLSNSTAERISYNFGDQVITVPVPFSNKNTIFKLIKDSLEIIPNQRVTGKNLIFDLPDADLTPGHYDLKLDGETIQCISLNYSKKESLMNFFNSDELKNILGKYKNITIMNSVDNENIANEIEVVKKGYPLWKVCLLIALFFLFIEILLLRFYKVYESPAKIS